VKSRDGGIQATGGGAFQFRFSLHLTEYHQKKESPSNKRSNLMSTANASQAMMDWTCSVQLMQCTGLLGRGERSAMDDITRLRKRPVPAQEEGNR
jgi:hypothetical protein